MKGAVVKRVKFTADFALARSSTEMVYKEGPRLRESHLLAPSGRGSRVHATWGPPYNPALYIKYQSENLLSLIVFNTNLNSLFQSTSQLNLIFFWRTVSLYLTHTYVYRDGVKGKP